MKQQKTTGQKLAGRGWMIIVSKFSRLKRRFYNKPDRQIAKQEIKRELENPRP